MTDVAEAVFFAVLICLLAWAMFEAVLALVTWVVMGGTEDGQE